MSQRAYFPPSREERQGDRERRTLHISGPRRRQRWKDASASFSPSANRVSRRSKAQAWIELALVGERIIRVVLLDSQVGWPCNRWSIPLNPGVDPLGSQQKCDVPIGPQVLGRRHSNNRKIGP